MITIQNRSQEAEARAYCLSIGVDPDEKVWGRDHQRFASGERVRLPRWQWYLGVSEGGLKRPI